MREYGGILKKLPEKLPKSFLYVTKRNILMQTTMLKVSVSSIL